MMSEILEGELALHLETFSDEKQFRAFIRKVQESVDKEMIVTPSYFLGIRQPHIKCSFRGEKMAVFNWLRTVLQMPEVKVKSRGTHVTMPVQGEDMLQLIDFIFFSKKGAK